MVRCRREPLEPPGRKRVLAQMGNQCGGLPFRGITRKQIGKVFDEEERAALLPLPPMLFLCFEEEHCEKKLPPERSGLQNGT